MTVNPMFSPLYIVTIIWNPITEYYGKKSILSTKKNIFTEKTKPKGEKKDIFVIPYFLESITIDRLLYLGWAILKRKK